MKRIGLRRKLVVLRNNKKYHQVNQATQQLVATTQQLVREQREHQQAAMARSDTPPASRPNVTIDTTEVPTTREGTPLSSGRSSNSGRSSTRGHSGRDRPAAIDCHENPHRATLLGAQGVTPITLMTEIVTTTPAIVIAPEANTVTETDNPGMAGMRRIATTGSLSVLPDMSS
ncbi:hypothetical protein F444_19308 [Phytophthora nicotianae P1976]|uniref:Uncharacterized protein n=1 Tax=Phytophthora nicotianae P1976 TaxID=1317066 RepID=A0A080Z8A1_PHYNI|nr:hypothetical protein F444_19308 [Phytophthora nicotianae P1976]